MREVEFTNRHLESMDEIHNAVHQCICVLLEQDPDETWDMGTIGPCTDVLVETLILGGKTDKIFYPYRTDDGDTQTIEEYITVNDFICDACEGCCGCSCEDELPDCEPCEVNTENVLEVKTPTDDPNIVTIHPDLLKDEDCAFDTEDIKG